MQFWKKARLFFEKSIDYLSANQDEIIFHDNDNSIIGNKNTV